MQTGICFSLVLRNSKYGIIVLTVEFKPRYVDVTVSTNAGRHTILHTHTTVQVIYILHQAVLLIYKYLFRL